jgi:hypothetical protein
VSKRFGMNSGVIQWAKGTRPSQAARGPLARQRVDVTSWASRAARWRSRCEHLRPGEQLALPRRRSEQHPRLSKVSRMAPARSASSASPSPSQPGCAREAKGSKSPSSSFRREHHRAGGEVDAMVALHHEDLEAPARRGPGGSWREAGGGASRGHRRQPRTGMAPAPWARRPPAGRASGYLRDMFARRAGWDLTPNELSGARRRGGRADSGARPQ